MRIVTGRLLFEHEISSPAIPLMWPECASSRGFFTTFCAEGEGAAGLRDASRLNPLIRERIELREGIFIQRGG
jgi:hypothetical protein